MIIATALAGLKIFQAFSNQDRGILEGVTIDEQIVN